MRYSGKEKGSLEVHVYDKHRLYKTGAFRIAGSRSIDPPSTPLCCRSLCIEMLAQANLRLARRPTSDCLEPYDGE